MRDWQPYLFEKWVGWSWPLLSFSSFLFDCLCVCLPYLFCAFWFISCSVFSKGHEELLLVGALGLNQEGVLYQTAWGLSGTDLTIIPAELPNQGTCEFQFSPSNQRVCRTNCVWLMDISGLSHPSLSDASIYFSF